MKVSYKKIAFPFKYPFKISKGTKTHQPSLIIELDHFGIKGYGEAPEIAYYNIPVDKMISDLEAKRSFIEKFSFHDPERYWHYLHHLIPSNPFLICALDMAAWDIFGKIKRKPLYELWGVDTSISPVTDYTIGIDSTEMMIKKIQEKPWPVYKIKVGYLNDVETIASLRKITDARLRVDANGGWSVDEAMEKIPELQSLGVELIEQPLHKDDWEGMKQLYNVTSIPLFADESCVAETDVLKCKNHFHGVNIKLTKCSGITPAKRMIEKARELDLQIMLGCMNETSVGIAALAHLAPLADFMDMDGPLLLSEDFASGITFKDGQIIYNDEPGLGISLLEQWHINEDEI